MDGFYSVPAGGLDRGETLGEAIVREAKEEVGITVEPHNIELIHTMHSFTNGEEWLGQFFLAKKWDGKPQLKEPDKHSEIRWVKLNDMPDNLIPYVKQAIENYSKDIQYSSFKL